MTSWLVPLLDHPDGEGELIADQCARILPRLVEIIDEWRRTDPEPRDRPRLDPVLAENLIRAGQVGCSDSGGLPVGS